MPIDRAVIPAQLFMPGRSNPAIRIGYGDRVAVIGAFPTISKTVISVNSYHDAIEELNIKPGINDKYHTNNPARNENQLNPTKDYFDGARCLKHLFREGSSDNNVSQTIIINTSTDSMQCASDDSTIKLLNGGLAFGEATDSADVISANGGTAPTTTPSTGSTSGEGSGEGSTSGEGGTSGSTGTGSTTTQGANGRVLLDKLDYALERLREEDYDILLLAFTPTLEQVERLIKFCKDEYRRSNPIGMIYGYGSTPRPVIKPETTSSVVESVVNTTKSQSITVEEQNAIKAQLEKFKKANVEENHHHTLYGLIPQSLKLTYEENYLAPIESAAYYCGVVAGRKVNESMIDEVIPYVESVNEDLVYEKNSVMGTATDGYALVEAGATMFKKNGRASDEVVCINSTQPGKGSRTYDLSHIRTAAYVIRKLDLREFFGEHENRVTYDAALTKLTTIQSNLVSQFNDILYNIAYSLTPHDNNCLDVYVQIEMYDVLLQEEIYVNEVVLPWQL